VSATADKTAQKRKPVESDGRDLRARRLRASRRTAILSAARRRFAQRGYHRTSIDDIIAEAGIARGTFYVHFESKRAIFDELLAELLQTLRSTVWRIDVSAGATSPTEQLEIMVARVLEALIENREMAGLLLREAVGFDEDFDTKLREFYGSIEALLVSALETGQEMGLLRVLRPTLTARAVLGMVKETVQWAIVDDNAALASAKPPGPKARVDVRSLARELIQLTLRGIFNPIPSP
jgi:AcrR family transcriptional regulator